MSGFLCALVAAVTAFVIGRGLSARLRFGFRLVSLSVFLGAGLGEVLGLIILAYFGILLHPFILAGAVLLTLSGRDGASRLSARPAAPTGTSGRRGRRRSGFAYAAWALLLSAGLVVTTVLIIEFLAPAKDVGDENWEAAFVWMALAGIVGAVSVVGICRLTSLISSSSVVSATFGVSFVALVSAHLLSSLSVAQAVYSDSVGIGGMLLWMAVAALFPLAGAVVLIVSALGVLLRPLGCSEPGGAARAAEPASAAAESGA